MTRFFALLTLLCSFAGIAHAEDDLKPLFTVSYGEAEASVASALTEKGAGTKIAAIINSSKTEALFSYTKPINVEVHGLTFDKPSGHWSANLLAVSDGNVITALPVAGRFDEMVEVPVLKRQVRNGEVIAAADIEIRDFPMTHTRTDTVTDLENLIGKSPVHSISAFRPVRELEVANPTLVKKNSLVQMHYNSSGMEISASGQAMEEGGKGSVITVRNLSSKRTLQAVVEDANNVSVSPMPDAPVSVQAPIQAMSTNVNNASVENPYAIN